ncbi:MAG: hypothetical protein QN120_01230 [Armatimonadota bacterium]|nr:hypothetical protein [Armatimonadota bacterium]
MTASDPRSALSGSELRRLLVLRSRLRGAVVAAPRAVRREVLGALEAARQRRQYGRARPWTPPEMTGDELIREIKWRLDAADLQEVDAAARVLERANRRIAIAARRRGRLR